MCFIHVHTVVLLIMVIALATGADVKEVKKPFGEVFTNDDFEQVRLWGMQSVCRTSCRYWRVFILIK